MLPGKTGSVSRGEIRPHSGSGLLPLLASTSESHHWKFLNDLSIMDVAEKSWSGWLCVSVCILDAYTTSMD